MVGGCFNRRRTICPCDAFKRVFELDKGWDIQLLATDLSTRVLKHAMEGKYLAEQISPLPEKWKKKYLKRISEEEYQVTEEVRKQVVFRQFNLMDNIKFKGMFHIVFTQCNDLL